MDRIEKRCRMVDGGAGSARDGRSAERGASNERADLELPHQPRLRPALPFARARPDLARGGGAHRPHRAGGAAHRRRAGGGRVPLARARGAAQPLRGPRGTAAARTRRFAAAPRAARPRRLPARRPNRLRPAQPFVHRLKSSLQINHGAHGAHGDLFFQTPTPCARCAPWLIRSRYFFADSGTGEGFGIEAVQEARDTLRSPISATMRAGSTATTIRFAADCTPGGTGMSARSGRYPGTRATSSCSVLRSASRSASLCAASRFLADLGTESAVGQTNTPIECWFGYTTSTCAALPAPSEGAGRPPAGGGGAVVCPRGGAPGARSGSFPRGPPPGAGGGAGLRRARGPPAARAAPAPRPCWPLTPPAGAPPLRAM